MSWCSLRTFQRLYNNSARNQHPSASNLPSGSPEKHKDDGGLPKPSSPCSRTTIVSFLLSPFHDSPLLSFCILIASVMLVAAIIILAILFSSIEAVDPVVSLPYGKYQGKALNNGISQWLGMRYAAAPVGNLRFEAPQFPPHHDGIAPATKLTPGCIGVGSKASDPGVSEDCLFLDVYAPSKATPSSKLPVYVFIQGGGLDGDDAHFNGSSLIQASGFDRALGKGGIVTVSLTYRGAALGFLGGKEIKSYNNGFKDQRRALHWVQLHIAQFGGDPAHVTLGGQSAGAGSVVQHLAAYSGRNDNLFHAAVAESPSLPAVRSIEESQYQYDHLVKRANCPNDPSQSLACLQALNITAFQKVHVSEPFQDQEGHPTFGNPIFSYTSIIDNDFITDHPSRLYAAGKFVHVPTIFGSNSDEGSIFTDQAVHSRSDSEAFLKKQYSFLTPTQLTKYNTMYGLDQQDSSPYWHRVSRAYGETRYICPSLYLSTDLIKYNNAETWTYRFDVLDPKAVAKGFGVPHGAELGAIWGVGGPKSYSGENKAIIPIMQGYWTSFIKSYDPNTYRAAGTPKWEQWVGGEQKRIRLDAKGTAMEKVEDAQKERCAYLSGIAGDLEQ